MIFHVETLANIKNKVRENWKQGETIYPGYVHENLAECEDIKNLRI